MAPGISRPSLATLCVMGAAMALMGGCGGGGNESGAVYCYVGGTMRPAMEELARQYEGAAGTKVVLDYGDSGSNLIKAEATGKGDLYVAHDPFHGAMQNKGLSREAWVVATLEPVIAVPKGNPKKIEGLKGLARPGLKLVLTDALYSTAGHVNAVMFKKAGLEAEIEKNVATRTRAGGEAANAVVLGHADAAIVWNAVVFLRRDKLDAVAIEASYRPVPGVDAVTSATFGPIDMGRIRVTLDLLKSTRHADAAKAFAEFCASPKGLEVWRSFGFGPPGGEVHLASGQGGPAPAAAGGELKGSLLVYCGAGLRTAMEDLARTFTAETGVRIETDYGGSGMIISRLRLSHRGDLFMPGDVGYVELAEKENLVQSKAMVCYFVPVILVQKGNPKRIQNLADLARPGLRLGLGRPETCQIGKAGEKLFEKNQIDRQAIEKNLVFSGTTVEELGIQVKAGGLDATIVWDAVAAQYAGEADVVPIPPGANEVSRVAIAVLKSCGNRPAAEEFVKFVQGADGQAILKKHRYRTEPPK